MGRLLFVLDDKGATAHALFGSPSTSTCTQEHRRTDGRFDADAGGKSGAEDEDGKENRTAAGIERALAKCGEPKPQGQAVGRLLRTGARACRCCENLQRPQPRLSSGRCSCHARWEQDVARNGRATVLRWNAMGRAPSNSNGDVGICRIGAAAPHIASTASQRPSEVGSGEWQAEKRRTLQNQNGSRLINQSGNGRTGANFHPASAAAMACSGRAVSNPVKPVP